MGLRNRITILDRISTKPSLLINSERRSKKFVGGLVTIGIWVIYILFVFIFSFDYFYYIKDGTIQSGYRIYKTKGDIQADFDLKFKILNSKININDIKITLTNTISNNKTNLIQIGFQPCSDLIDYYCIDDIYNIKLINNHTNFSNLKFSITNLDTIDSTQNNIEISYQTRIIDRTTNQIENITRTDRFKTNLNAVQALTWSNYKINTNYILNYVTSERLLNFEDLVYYNTNNLEKFEIVYELNNYVKVYNIYAPKIQMGLLSAFLYAKIIEYIVLFIYNELDRYRYLDDLTNFVINRDKNLNNSEKAAKIKPNNILTLKNNKNKVNLTSNTNNISTVKLFQSNINNNINSNNNDISLNASVIDESNYPIPTIINNKPSTKTVRIVEVKTPIVTNNNNFNNFNKNSTIKNIIKFSKEKRTSELILTPIRLFFCIKTRVNKEYLEARTKVLEYLSVETIINNTIELIALKKNILELLKPILNNEYNTLNKTNPNLNESFQMNLE